jgi:hypothetical protein
MNCLCTMSNVSLLPGTTEKKQTLDSQTFVISMKHFIFLNFMENKKKKKFRDNIFLENGNLDNIYKKKINEYLIQLIYGPIFNNFMFNIRCNSMRLVDGRKRCLAIYLFIRNKIPVILSDSQVLFFRDFQISDRQCILKNKIHMTFFKNLSNQDEIILHDNSN